MACPTDPAHQAALMVLRRFGRVACGHVRREQPDIGRLTMRTDLYRHFDEHGNLLYVGISVTAVVRFSQHRVSAQWYDAIRTMTIEKFNTREEAYKAEQLAIENEKPLFNILFGERPRPESTRIIGAAEVAHLLGVKKGQLLMDVRYKRCVVSPLIDKGMCRWSAAKVAEYLDARDRA